MVQLRTEHADSRAIAREDTGSAVPVRAERVLNCRDEEASTGGLHAGLGRLAHRRLRLVVLGRIRVGLRPGRSDSHGQSSERGGGGGSGGKV
jgi:hypothetical protein